MLDFFTLSKLRTTHPAWQLLCANHAPLIISFLHQAFIVPNKRTIDESILIESLEDNLYQLRESLGEDKFPQSARFYLNEWAEPQNAWLRKFYKTGSDEAQFDLTPASEKAITWMISLTKRQFIGTESRLLSLFNLLKEIRQGSELNPDKRIAELEAQRANIDVEIEQIKAGNIAVFDDTAIKERYLQFHQGARELLSDFREVEYNFRQLDKKVRQQIALWDGHKGELLTEIMGERDAISQSDQGKSFRAFWDFLLSPQHQKTFSTLLEEISQLPSLSGLVADYPQTNIHYDWLEAGEHTQRTIAQLSQQLRHFLDNKAWLENRRIMQIFHEIEEKTLKLDEYARKQFIIMLDDVKVDIHLPINRPLYRPSIKPKLKSDHLQTGNATLQNDILWRKNQVDKEPLIAHISQLLAIYPQVSLQMVIQTKPLTQGLPELIAYLQLKHHDNFHIVIDDKHQEIITWQSTQLYQVTLPKVIFSR